MALRRVVTIVIASGLMAGFFSTFSNAPAIGAQTAAPPAPAGRQGGTGQGARQGGAPQGGGFVAAPGRRPGEGIGPFKTLLIRGVMVIDGTGAPPYGPMNVTVENNRILRITSAGTPGLPARQGGAPPNADQVIDAPGMYLLPGFVDMHVHAGGPPKNAEAEYAYKLWLAHGVTTVRGVPMARTRFHRQRTVARGEERDRRAAHHQLPAAGQRLVRRRGEHAREGPRMGALGGRQRDRRPQDRRRGTVDHGGAARRGEEEQSRQHGPSAADGRRADERDQSRAPRPAIDHALLRTLRIAVARLRRPAVARRHELQRRTVALRSGRAPVGSDSSARQPGVEGVPRGAPEARHRVRSHADDLFGRPRRDALPRRRMARQVHAAVADGLLRARAGTITAPTGTTGRPRTRWRGGISIRCGSA